MCLCVYVSSTQWERAQNEVQITGGSSSASSLAQGSTTKLI